tara:strand:- start:531 stop:779 length:249 start_codon:yes stop_codon:yes gene_type:complete
MEKTYEINTKLCNKENRDLIYSISGKKHLNGILHYLLESGSGKIYLSEHAIKERYIVINKDCEIEKPVVSRLYTKITNTVTK